MRTDPIREVMVEMVESSKYSLAIATRSATEPMKERPSRAISRCQSLMLACAIMFALAACGKGEAAGDREEGQHLARQWCSSCHSVDDTQEGSDAAPAFSNIAISRGEDVAWVKAWLSSPHPAMPDMNLSREEVDDIISYLSSLARH